MLGLACELLELEPVRIIPFCRRYNLYVAPVTAKESATSLETGPSALNRLYQPFTNAEILDSN